jgi:hypothetical protein
MLLNGRNYGHLISWSGWLCSCTLGIVIRICIPPCRYVIIAQAVTIRLGVSKRKIESESSQICLERETIASTSRFSRPPQSSSLANKHSLDRASVSEQYVMDNLGSRLRPRRRASASASPLPRDHGTYVLGCFHLNPFLRI